VSFRWLYTLPFTTPTFSISRRFRTLCCHAEIPGSVSPGHLPLILIRPNDELFSWWGSTPSAQAGPQPNPHWLTIPERGLFTEPSSSEPSVGQDRDGNVSVSEQILAFKAGDKEHKIGWFLR
jgi:hypothetical protein